MLDSSVNLTIEDVFMITLPYVGGFKLSNLLDTIDGITDCQRKLLY